MRLRLYAEILILFGCSAHAQQPNTSCSAIEGRLAGHSKAPFVKQTQAEQSENFLNATKYMNVLLTQEFVRVSAIRSKKDNDNLVAWDAAHDDHCLDGWMEAREIAAQHGLLQKKHMSKDLAFEVALADELMKRMAVILLKYDPIPDLPSQPTP